MSAMVKVGGEQMMLLPEKAVFWPAERMLIIADIHFGKAAAFRAQGVPVPRGTTSENLAGLDFLVAAHGARRIMFLGDFLHALAGHIHPVYVLATRFDALRLPCFVVGRERMILPSFGAFTGGHAIRPGPGDSIYVTSGEAVHSVR